MSLWDAATDTEREVLSQVGVALGEAGRYLMAEDTVNATANRAEVRPRPLTNLVLEASAAMDVLVRQD